LEKANRRLAPLGDHGKTQAAPCRWRAVHAMNRSKPSIVVEGGEMKRVTSSVVNNINSAGASL
jgi:hypothetical protein